MVEELIKEASIEQLNSTEFSELVTLIPKLVSYPLDSNKVLAAKIVEYLNKNQRFLKDIDIKQSLILLMYIKTFASGSISNVFSLQICYKLETKVRGLEDLVIYLTFLTNLKIVPKNMIPLLQKFDSKNRRDMSNCVCIYYITAYCNLYKQTKEFPLIINKGLENIEDLLQAKHKEFSIIEKSLVFSRMKDISSQNKQLLIANDLIANLNELTTKYFGSTIYNLYKTNHLQIKPGQFIPEIESRLRSMGHKELILIGRALSWFNEGDEKFWMNFFQKLDSIFRNEMLDNTPWACTLYSIFYSLSKWDENLSKKLVEIAPKIDFEKLKTIYFTRPNMSMNDELNLSEHELEQALKDLGLDYKRQTAIGIIIPDFIIRDKYVIEIYGRHHYAERNNLNGPTKWRESLLQAEGYKVIGIALSKWNSFNNGDVRKEYIKSLLDKA
jgi:very-short-patch-repair endonuclease